MLTILRYFVPSIKDIHYSIMVEYCAANAKRYCKMKDVKNALYWSEKMSEYLIKRLELILKKRA